MGDKSKKKDPLLNSTMSLGDHLEELRFRLLCALGGLAVGATDGYRVGTGVRIDAKGTHCSRDVFELVIAGVFMTVWEIYGTTFQELLPVKTGTSE